ncbi:MAG: CBS domain-containing protein [Bacteroidia bacterium]|nr:CBS domain-containing protein [Bacteroidia bacterium]
MELAKYIILDTQLIEHAIEMIELNASRCVVVTNNNKRVVGVLSEGDILRALLKGTNIKSPVKNIINPGYKYLMQFDDNKLMLYFKQGITLVPVLNENNELSDVINIVKYMSEKFNL